MKTKPPKLTRQQFEHYYFGNIRRSHPKNADELIREIKDTSIAMPCRCDFERCRGWSWENAFEPSFKWYLVDNRITRKELNQINPDRKEWVESIIKKYNIQIPEK